jgi:hypothetical protein
MTENEWLGCLEPGPMLNFLCGRVSQRKLCLFAVACCERIAELLADARSRSAVAALRRFADGRADREEMGREQRDAGRAANSAIRAAFLAAVGAEALDRVDMRPILSTGPSLLPGLVEVVGPTLASAAEVAVAKDAAVNAAWAAEQATRCALSPARDKLAAGRFTADHAARAAGEKGAECLAQCRLLRDIVGNPFRAAVLDPSWLTWGDGASVSLARAIYQRHDFRDLPVLADALEDAGCTEEGLLNHCRDGGAHVRGCWAVDLLLGNE